MRGWSGRARTGAGGNEAGGVGRALNALGGLAPSRQLRACSLLLLTACANIQSPPGGPPDKTPPELAGVYPDSLAILPGFKGNVEFRFNEVVSEGSQPSQGRGTGDLERLVILSPTNKFPDVGWHRSRITVRPAEGWQPNRVYRVELLPGITDVRQNRSKVERIVTFTTGAQLPRDTLTGTVFDWKAGAPAMGALVEALLEPDSLPYRTLADSGGRFSLAPVPKGEYLVYGVLDQNRNLRREAREAFDTVRVRPESLEAAKTELYAFVHDTLPPRIVQVTPTDSVTASISFATSLDPYQKLDASAATVRRLPDSTVVPVVALLLRDTTQLGGEEPALVRRADTTAAARADTLAARRRADSIAARFPDSLLARGRAAAGPPRPRMSRPPLSDHITLKVGRPWHPGDRFAIAIAGVRTVSGTVGDVHAPLIIQQQRTRPGVPSDSAAADSVRPRPEPADSAKRERPESTSVPDSVRRQPE